VEDTVMSKKELTHIGRNVSVDFIGHIDNVPAKIDTGADSSSVWASHVFVDENDILFFQLFNKESPYYSGKTLKRKYYKVVSVRNSTGHEQRRYKVQLSLRIANRRVRATLNLSDRSLNKFPILIGRRTLNNKFIVDVSKITYNKSVSKNKSNPNNKTARNSRTFHK
jgi:hypothetical protein